MPNKREFQLDLLFDKDQITVGSLEADLQGILAGVLTNGLRHQVRPDTSENPVLSIWGSLEEVDACQARIMECLVDPKNLMFARLVDEAGNEIRRRAYPIIARIEQKLRAFIDHVCIAVLGFDKWHDFLRRYLLKRHRTSDKSLDLSKCGCLLELTQFDDLIDIITAKHSDWDSAKPLLVQDFVEVLHEASSVDELREKIAQKLSAVSLWDRVFGSRFKDQADWEQIKKEIKFVVAERHKVMHHRPMRLGILEALKAKEGELAQLLDTADLRMPEEDRAGAEQELVMAVDKAIHGDGPALGAREWILNEALMATVKGSSLSDTLAEVERQALEMAKWSNIQKAVADAKLMAGVNEALMGSVRGSSLNDTLAEVGRQALKMAAWSDIQKTVIDPKLLVDTNEALMASIKNPSLDDMLAEVRRQAQEMAEWSNIQKMIIDSRLMAGVDETLMTATRAIREAEQVRKLAEEAGIYKALSDAGMGVAMRHASEICRQALLAATPSRRETPERPPDEQDPTAPEADSSYEEPCDDTTDQGTDGGTDEAACSHTDNESL